VIEEARGRIDYDECGAGPTVVLVPGSCSTGAAWRPVIDSTFPLEDAAGAHRRLVNPERTGKVVLAIR